jgi:hypothetical protein
LRWSASWAASIHPSPRVVLNPRPHTLTRSSAPCSVCFCALRSSDTDTLRCALQCMIS